MKNKFIFLILLFSLPALTVVRGWAQSTMDIDQFGSSDINLPGPADESVAQGDGSQPGQNKTGAQVNTFTGDAEATATDFNYRRIGFNLEFERYFHNGITSPFGEMGQGWMSNYDVCLFVPLPNTGGNHALLVMPHQSWRFSTTDGGNTFSAPPGCFFKLQTAATSAVITGAPSNFSTTTYVLTDKTGLVYKFNVLTNAEPNIARLVEMDDLNGNKTNLTYQPFNYYQESYSTYIYQCTTTLSNSSCSTPLPPLVGIPNPPAVPTPWNRAISRAFTPLLDSQASAFFNGQIYVIGGKDSSGTAYDTVWHSSNGNTWFNNSSGIGPRFGHQALVFNGQLWVIGGMGPNNTLRHDVWHTSDGVNWYQATNNAPFGGREYSAAVSLNNNMYVIGGLSDHITNGVYDDVWSSPDGTHWTQVTPHAGIGPRDEFGCVVFNNAIWVMGGASGTGVNYNDVNYSTDGQTWHNATTSAAFGRRYNFSSVVYDNQIFVIGGQGLNNSGGSFPPSDGTGLTNTVYASPDGVNWSLSASNPGAPATFFPRVLHTSVVANNQLWTIGGQVDISGSVTWANDVWNAPDYWCYNCGWVPQNSWSVADSSCRLQSVSGNNWGVTFSYYDNTNWTSLYQSNSLAVSELQNPYGGRLRLVTNSAGDAVTFDSGITNGSYANTGPITQVSRSPSALNASYQYYSYPGASTPSGSTTITTLKQVVDPLSPVGYRNLTYVSENNASTGANNPVRQILNNMGQVMFAYDYSADGSGNKLTSTSGPNGLMETDVYDSTSRMVQKRFQVDGHPFNENYTWNSNDLMTNKVDGNGHAVTMSYDSLGNMTYRQDAENYPENYTFTQYGYPSGLTGNSADYYSRLTASQDKNQVNRSYDYDGNGNLMDKYEPGRTASYSHYTNGLLKTVTDGNVHVTTYGYDTNGNLNSVQAPGAGFLTLTTGYVYDNGVLTSGQGRGLLTSKTDALIKTTNYNYNSQHFLFNVQYPDSTGVTYFYNADGAVTQTLDQNGNFTNTTLDAEDRPLTIVQAAIRTTSFQLDPIGNKLSVTDGGGNTTRFTYNEQNLVRTSVDSAGVGATNSYDGALNLLTARDTRGVTKTLGYYKNNRLKTVSFSDGTPGLSYTYDGNGNRKSMTDAVGLKAYFYDPLNRLQSVTDSTRNFTLNYTYDAVGNRLSSQNNKVSGIEYYGYYPDNQMSAVTDVDGATANFAYDPMKNPQTMVYSNGVTTVYNYISTNHCLQSIQNINSHQEVISSCSYTYDRSGNVTLVSDLTGPTTYGYDNLYQLTSATGPQGSFAYAYNGGGNSVTEWVNNLISPQVTNTYGPGNELTLEKIQGLGNFNISYDGNGNVLQRGSIVYTWDALSQLKTASAASGTVTFVYDGDGHRVEKMSPAGIVNYFYDGSSVVLETDGLGNVLKTYNPGISVKDSQGNKFFFLRNGHGDVGGLVDGQQDLVQDYTYDPFGTALGNQKDSNHYRYVGLSDVYSDDDIGLQYMWHRWYDPTLGRFISRDPLGLADELNQYVYVGNNPINGMDCGGLFTLSIGGLQTYSALGGYSDFNGIVFGLSAANGFQFGTISSTSKGVITNLGEFGGADIQMTTADDINWLSGTNSSGSAGKSVMRSLREGEVVQFGGNIGGGSSGSDTYLSLDVSGGLGLSVLPIDASGMISSTTVTQLGLSDLNEFFAYLLGIQNTNDLGPTALAASDPFQGAGPGPVLAVDDTDAGK